MQTKTPLSDKELIGKLKEECRRVKVQRNLYEEKLRCANKKIVELSEKLQRTEKSTARLSSTNK